MRKDIYDRYLEVINHFMQFERQNNLIWSSTHEYGTALFEACGYTVSDWSWYDGPIISLCTEDIRVSYAACAAAYSFNMSTEVLTAYESPNEFTVEIEEVPKLASAERLGQHVFDRIMIKKKSPDGKVWTDAKVYPNSDNYTEFENSLIQWQKEFDKDSDYLYSITIYLGEGVEIEKL